jgi:RNA recognition motif-containing protein
MEFENYIADVSPVNGKLFVGQLPKDITESALSSYFEEFGSIKEISIIRDSNNLSRGILYPNVIFPFQ